MKKRTIAALTATAAAAATTAVVATSATAASSADAVRAVQTASKGVSARPYELDRERNRWEVTFADGTERHVSLDGRKVTKTVRDDDRSSEAAAARVTLVTALRNAAPRANATLTDADLDTERGVLVWTVGFANDTEVEVDAKTGKVLRVTHDD